jgi:hypothetical protein
MTTERIVIGKDERLVFWIAPGVLQRPYEGCSHILSIRILFEGPTCASTFYDVQWNKAVYLDGTFERLPLREG